MLEYSQGTDDALSCIVCVCGVGGGYAEGGGGGGMERECAFCVLNMAESQHRSRPAYPSVFDRICTEIGQQYGCMPVFLKIRTQSFQKSRHEQMRVCCQQSQCRALMGSYWHSHISSHFWGWSIRLVLISQSLLNQWTSTLHQNFTEVSHLPMAGLNSKLSMISGCTKPTKRRKNAWN